MEAEVSGAVSEIAADRVARSIANSPLVKTALASGDSNWSRILSAGCTAGVALSAERFTFGLVARR